MQDLIVLLCNGLIFLNKIEVENEKQPLVLTGLDTYYRNEFTDIYDSNEVYKGKWNWWAFLFSFIWLFYKGAWGYGIAYITIFIAMDKFLDPMSTNAIFPLANGILTLIMLLLVGYRGNWIFYNVKINKSQYPKTF